MTADRVAYINPQAQGGQDAADIASRLADALPGVQATVLGESADVASLARSAVAEGARCVVVAGGDGTINAVAGALKGTSVLLGIIPVGTFNHFARDLGIPLEVDRAIDVIANRHAAPVDAGEVNGRLFLNNAGIGLYPEMVTLRERRRKHGAAKWPSLLWATAKVLARYHRLTIRLEADGRELVRTTPAVFVGNNDYTMEGLRIGTRSRLDQHRLSIFVPTHAGPWALIRDTLRAMLGRKDGIDALDELTASELVIDAGKRRISVSTDGELARLATPLRFRALPDALRVLVPPAD